MLEIRKIISEYDKIDHDLENVALATVINVEESAYRRIGARMLVRSNGTWIGGISGGCLEGDALKQSLNAIYKNESSIVIYDTMDNDPNQIGIGLGCNGKIEVLFSPINPDDPNNEIEILRKLLDADKPSILAKIISDDKKLQVHTILLDGGSPNFGFEEINKIQLQEAIKIVLQKRSPKLFSIKTDEEKSVKVLLEFIRPETRLIIVGDNYDVDAMAKVATALGWNIWIVGRLKKLNKSVVKKVKKIIPFEDHVKVIPNEFTAVVLMTHDYQWDKKILQHFIKHKTPYIGMLGPKKRTQKMNKELTDLDIEKIDAVHSPAGLDIGAESPEEISISIVSEIIAVFRKKQGYSLKLKEGPIHERGI